MDRLDSAIAHSDFTMGVASSFLTADVSGDGKLEPAEFAPAAINSVRRFLPTAAEGMTPAEVSGLFGAFDMDGDGTLNVSEFVLFVQWVMVSTVAADVDKILELEEDRRRKSAEQREAEARESHVETKDERLQRLNDEAHVAELLVDQIIEEVQRDRVSEVEAIEAAEAAAARDAAVAAEVAAAAAGASAR